MALTYEDIAPPSEAGSATASAQGKPAPGTPDWWRDRLHGRLIAEQRRLAVYDAYYEGRHPLAFASKKFREAFGGLFEEFADNWTDIVVDASAERLSVQGFRFGGEPNGDEDAWALWQENQLDAESQLAHVDALVYGKTYALVWPGPDNSVEITVESPLQVILETVPGFRRRRAAAFKEWRDDWDGHLMATLYLPDGVYKWRSTRSQSDLGEGNTVRWTSRVVNGERWPLPNPFREVPVVCLPNKPRTLRAGMSEIHKVIPQQDAVNKLVADMLVASEFGAYLQRWATGLELNVDEETGQSIAPLKAAVDRLWINPDPQGSFGAFPPTELQNFVTGIEMFVQHIASQTRTPPHYFFLRGELPSGETIKSAETGLVAKVRSKMLFLGEAWEEVIRLAFIATNRAERAPGAETIWADPESRSESEHVDAVMKMQALGVPQEALWEELNFSPQQIERFRDMRQAEAEMGFPQVVPLGE